MSKRNRREHGRIISVETLTRGDSLAADVAAGATSITVNDAGDFDEDGGWLYIGAQTVAYTGCDDDTGIITLATALTAAGEQGDPVAVWSDLYGEVVDYQQALVELDGEYDNPDPVVAEVAEGVGDLPEGDRGKAGESCTLKRVADDEWEIVGVGGRSRKSRGVRWEQDDFYVLTAGDIAAGSATMPLSHRPNDEALTCYLAGVPQRPTEWTIDYDAQTLTMPLDGWEQAGDVLWVHYAYLKGVTTPQVVAAITPDGAFADGGGAAGNPWELGPFADVASSDFFLSLGFTTAADTSGNTFTTTGLGATWTQIGSAASVDNYARVELDKGVGPSDAPSGQVVVTASDPKGDAAGAIRVRSGSAVTSVITKGAGSEARAASLTPAGDAQVVAFVAQWSVSTPSPTPAGWTKQAEHLGDSVAIYTKDGTTPAGSPVTFSIPAPHSGYWFVALAAVTG